ncbi:Enoyl-CoA hydratase/carnithine racemase [Rhodococcus koreensis]|uniref:Enoyl-CoA hydratase/carnithine racemase n=2 Tax=Rhodococcus koreensis TaxID=99653 RepID=A0A1H4L2W0_9NOCA|nr:Enoyl-CoA hydratase/carnithine racemase [Rhodococcus koreensis]
MTDYEDLIYEVTDPVALITINRPKQRNAFRGQTMHELRHAVESAVADERVVGIVATGAGEGFCVGLDAANLVQAVKNGPRSTSEATVGSEAPALFSYLRDVPKPVIAAVNGTCAGGGFVLAIMADLRFVAKSAAFHTVFSKRGLIAEHGTSWLLPRLIGVGRALDLLWSSRRVDAAEAASIGLADRVVDDDDLVDTAVSYIRDLAKSASPRSLSVSKELVYNHLDREWHEAAVDADVAMQNSVRSADFAECVASFVEHRPPRFFRIGDPGRDGAVVGDAEML